MQGPTLAHIRQTHDARGELHGEPRVVEESTSSGDGPECKAVAAEHESDEQRGGRTRHRTLAAEDLPMARAA